MLRNSWVDYVCVRDIIEVVIGISLGLKWDVLVV